MTNEELAAAIQAGDREKMLDLWEGVRRFAYLQAHRWDAAFHGTRGVTLEDLEQVAFLALLDALEGFQATCGSFIAWYALRLKTAFSEACGVRTRRDMLDPLASALSLDAPLTNEDGDTYTLADTLEDPAAALGFQGVEDGVWREQLHAALFDVLETLPQAERDTIQRRFYEGAAWADLGPDARSTQEKAMRKLRRPAVTAALREFIEDRTPYYAHVGLETFQRTGESAVERAVFQREQLEEEQLG